MDRREAPPSAARGRDDRPATTGMGPGAPFLAGVLTASVVALVLGAALLWEIGPRIVRERLLRPPTLEVPDDLLAELTALGAVVDNADNPTGAREHDTILVRPDPELGYTLRPGARIDAWTMPAGDALNLDPPVIYVPAGARLSPDLRAYLEAESVRSYRYEVDGDGHRRTLPAVRADRRLLVVGDSAAFGIGVDDEHTIASWLQRRVGERTRVVNAGVGGYDGARAVLVARRLSDASRFDALVYVAHHNDFEVGDLYRVSLAREIVASLAALSDRFAGGVVIATVPYLEYVSRGLWGPYGFRPSQLESSDELWRELPGIVASAGLGYVDGAALLGSAVRDRGSPFAPLALYADHAHLSPDGNRMLAERIHAALFPPGPP